MANKPNPTMKDIALSLGVSTSLVSYVLNGRGDEMRISKEMQEKVKEKAQEIDYHTNLYAKRVNKQIACVPALSLFWPFESNTDLLNDVFAGIHMQQKAEPSEFDMVLQLYERLKLFQADRHFRSDRTNGALVFATAYNDWDYLEKTSFPMPIAFLNHRSSKYTCAYVNLEKSMEQAVQLLVQAECHTVGLLCGIRMLNQSAQAEYFKKHCADAGINVLKASFDQQLTNESSGSAAMEAMLKETGGTPPDVVVALAARMARGAEAVLRHYNLASSNTRFLVFTNQMQMQESFVYSWSTVHLPIDTMCSWCISQLLHSPNRVREQEFSVDWQVNDHFFDHR